jgi:hypothetical protein
MTKRSTSSSKAPRLEAVPSSAGGPIDNAVGFVITKAVKLPQLQAEINQLSAVQVTNTALTGPNDITQPISDSNTAVLWISPQGVDPVAVAQAVFNHVPQPSWGIPQVVQDFTALMEQLRDKPDMPLSADQLETIIRGLALTFTVVMNPLGR